MTFFVAYLTGEANLTPQKAGAIFAVLGFFSIVSGILWGWVSDILGRRYGLVLAYCALALACLLVVSWKTTPAFYASSIIFGLTLSSMPSIIAAAIGDSMGGRLAPAALGFATLLFGIGQSIAPALAGWMKDTSGTFIGCFILSAAVFLLGAGGSLLLQKKA
jgi:MFS family permease